MLLLQRSNHTVGTFCSAAQAPNFCTSLPYTGCPSCIWSCPKAYVLFFGGSVGHVTASSDVPAAASSANAGVIKVLAWL